MDATVLKHLEMQTEMQKHHDRTNAIEAKVNRLSAAVAQKPNGNVSAVDALAPLVKEISRDIAALKRRVAELESRPQIKYLGVHKPDAIYSEGTMITRDGSVFYARTRTRETPGDGCQDWVLAVKRGKDAVSR